MPTDTEFQAARERDQRKPKNDPNRCWDCKWIESCQCDGRWDR
jgi:hypothetical protein